MTVSREWATPLTMGAFGVLATTGVLMFFHLDTGLNKEAHEWLGWALLAGVGLHVAANFAAFKRYLKLRRAQAVVGVFALLLAGSFLPLADGGGKPPFVAPVQALAAAPLPVIAAAARISPAEARQRLVAAGVAVPEGDGPVPALAAAGLGRQMRLLNAVLGTAER